ncbi:helix-turn-helix domain-containing protein, partial [Anoxybacillus sp. LAT27]
MSYYSFFSGIFQQKNPKKKQNMKGMVNMDNVKGVISKRIKQRLKQLNLKQKDLVEQTGQPKSTINKIVNGTVTPRVDLLIPISKVLDVSIDWLVA